MSVPSGRLQFFALEAGDYLERLGMIVGRPTPPDPDELVRLTRALRGASLMAGLSAFSHAAGALEHIAKAHRGGQWAGGPAGSELLAEAIEELKRLARLAAEWSDRETDAASRLANELIGALNKEGVETPVQRAAATDELQPSVRVFVAKEGAMIAGTLEHAAQAIELGQPAETADVVLQRMQPLRGLAALPRLSPLPEFLDAIELAMRVVRDGAAPPDAPRALRQVAASVTYIAREIADHGRATADSAATAMAARTLLAVFGSEDDVVDIRDLFQSDDATPILRAGAAPAREGADPLIELVSLGDRLRQGADQLVNAATDTARALELHALVSQLRPLTRDTGSRYPSLIPLLAAIMRAITSGRGESAPARFADLLRDAAERLARSAESRNAIFLGDDLEDLTQALALADVIAMPPPERPAAPAPVAPAEAASVAQPSEAEIDTPIVPIESLFFDEPVPIESLAPEPVAPIEPPGAIRAFARSFSTYHELRYRAEAHPPAGVESAVVPIDSLLYRGRRALERANVVRLELSGALQASLTFDAIEPLVSELIDLVPLALAE